MRVRTAWNFIVDLFRGEAPALRRELEACDRWSESQRHTIADLVETNQKLLARLKASETARRESKRKSTGILSTRTK